MAERLPGTLAVSLVLSLLGCTGQAGDPVDRVAAGILGGTDDGATHPEVFFLLLGTPTENGIACTGTLVAPRLLLTARHCVLAPDPADLGKPVCEQGLTVPRDFRQFAGASNLPTAGEERSPRAIAGVHFEAPVGPSCGRDVALVELEQPVAMVALAEPRLEAPPAAGDSLLVVGYGSDGAATNEELVRRARAGVIVSEVDASSYRVDVGPCGGDSGGPAFDGAGRLVGVMSRGSPLLCRDMTYERVDVHAAWLRGTVRQVSEESGDAVPEWARESPLDPEDGGGEAGASPPPPGAENDDGGCAISARSPGTGQLALSTLALAALLLTARPLRRRGAGNRRAVRRTPLTPRSRCQGH